MDEKIVIPIITAALGVIVTLGAQQLKWINDRNNKRDESRRKFIRELRATLSSKNYDKEDFVNSHLYSQLRPYLSISTINEMENLSSKITLVIGQLRTNVQSKVLDEISELERKWKLI